MDGSDSLSEQTGWIQDIWGLCGPLLRHFWQLKFTIPTFQTFKSRWLASQVFQKMVYKIDKPFFSDYIIKHPCSVHRWIWLSWLSGHVFTVSHFVDCVFYVTGSHTLSYGNGSRNYKIQEFHWSWCIDQWESAWVDQAIFYLWSFLWIAS